MSHLRLASLTWLAVIGLIPLSVCVGQGVGPKAEHVPDEILVKFSPGVSASDVGRINRGHGSNTLGVLKRSNAHRIRVPKGTTVDELVAAYGARPDVVYAEPNYIARTLWVPTDPYYAEHQWSFQAINMEDAWDIQPGGSKSVTVAVVDTGVAYADNGRHYALAPDLALTNFVPGYDFIPVRLADLERALAQVLDPKTGPAVNADA